MNPERDELDPSNDMWRPKPSQIRSSGTSAKRPFNQAIILGITFGLFVNHPHAAPALNYPRTGFAEADGTVTKLLVANGVLYLAGNFTNVLGNPRSGIAAVEAQSGRVLAWRPALPEPPQLLGVSERALFAVTQSVTFPPPAKATIVALDLAPGTATQWQSIATGSGSWGGPFNLGNAVRCIASAGDRIFVGGWFTNIGGVARQNLAALEGATGKTSDWSVPIAAAVLALEAVGDRLFVGTNERGRELVEVNVQSKEAFALDLWGETPQANRSTAVFDLLQRDGKLFVTAASNEQAPLPAENIGVIVAFDLQTRSRLWTYSAARRDTFSYRFELALTKQTLLVSGYVAISLGFGGIRIENLWAHDPNTGALLADFSTGGEVNALASDGETFFVGGRFTRIRDHARTNLAAFSPAGFAHLRMEMEAASGDLHLVVDGNPEETHVLERSDDLKSWRSIATNTLKQTSWILQPPRLAPSQSYRSVSKP